MRERKSNFRNMKAVAQTNLTDEEWLRDIFEYERTHEIAFASPRALLEARMIAEMDKARRSHRRARRNDHMNTLLQEIADCVESFVQAKKLPPSVVKFPKPKWNDLLKLKRQDMLLAGIATESDIEHFLGLVFVEGPKAFSGRKIFGLKIEFDGFGSKFVVE